MRRFLFSGFFCAVLLGCVQVVWSAETAASKPAPASPATYLGNEVCKACHTAQFETFSQTMMGKIFLFNARNEKRDRPARAVMGREVTT